MKNKELRLSQQEYSQFENLVGQKYSLIFEAINETLKSKREEYMTYLNAKLSKNKERI